MANGERSRDIKATDDHLARISKLLPAEITAAYLGIRTILSPEANDYDFFIGVFAVLIFLIAPFFMYYVQNMRRISQIAFLLFSYVVWVANVEIGRFTVHDEQIQAFIDGQFDEGYLKSMAETLVEPAFIKGILVIWVLLAMPFLSKRYPR